VDHQGTIIRPPNEAGSILLQVAVGCPHGACTFCGAYQGHPYRPKAMATVADDVDFAAHHCQDQRRVFLCGGDALALPAARLLEVLALVRARLPWVTRVGAYGSARSLAARSDAELSALRQAGLATVYMGLESGDDAVLARVRKGTDSAAIVAQGRRARAAGLRLNVTVLLGLAGEEGAQAHARATGAALTAMQPDHVGALTLMLVPGTALFAEAARGAFALPGPMAMLAELRTLLEHTRLERGQFLADHASNHLALRVRLPGGRAEALERIDAALAGRVPLRRVRGL